MTLHHFCVCQPLPREVQEPAGSSRPLRPLFWFCSGWHLFLAHFTCCTMVNLGDSFKIQPILSSALKTSGAHWKRQTNNENSFEELCCISWKCCPATTCPLDSACFTAPPDAAHAAMPGPPGGVWEGHEQHIRVRLMFAAPLSHILYLTWNSCFYSVFNLTIRSAKYWLPECSDTGRKKHPKLPCHDLRMPSTCGAGKFIDCMIQSASFQWTCVA